MFQIKAIIIKDGESIAKTFNRKNENRARNDFYNMSVMANVYAVALWKDGKVIEVKERKYF